MQTFYLHLVRMVKFQFCRMKILLLPSKSIIHISNAYNVLHVNYLQLYTKAHSVPSSPTGITTQKKVGGLSICHVG